MLHRRLRSRRPPARREEKNVDSGDARAELNNRIGQIFRGGSFDAIPFPGGPFDVPDDVGNGRPKLVVLAYDAVTIGAAEDVPELVRRIYLRKGSDGSALRLLRNNVVFVPGHLAPANAGWAGTGPARAPGAGPAGASRTGSARFTAPGAECVDGRGRAQGCVDADLGAGPRPGH